MKNDFLLLKVAILLLIFEEQSSISSLPENLLYKAIEKPEPLTVIDALCQKNESAILEKSPNNRQTSLDLVLEELCIKKDASNHFEKDRFFYAVGFLLLHHVVNSDKTFTDMKNAHINHERYYLEGGLSAIYCQIFDNDVHAVEKALYPGDIKAIKDHDFKRYKPQQYQRKNQPLSHKKLRR